MRIRVEHVSKKFDKVTAVNDLNLTIEEGQLVCLLGPSGCGKSTLLNVLSGILPVSSGSIYFDDVDVTHLEPQKRGVGLVFQNYALYPHMSVLENICFPLEIKKVDKATRVKKAIEMAKLVKIEDYLDRKPSELSGGQQQRVAIARALIKEPKLLLLDEPLSNLDARLRLEMREEIRRIQQETKVTTIFVTHDQEEAMSISDCIVLMKDGFLMQQDKPQALYDQPQKLFVAQFLGNPPINTVEGIVDGNTFYAEGKYPIALNNSYDKTEAILAIRAEAVKPDKDNYHFEALVKERFIMGKEELSILTIGNNNFRFFINSEHIFNVQDHIRIKLRDKGVFIFDRKTGERL
ncbi:MAG: ABC transporter ATP-binding protein [Erysipelotrichaceae bacterium]|nr:ABC transporter ATP-binding protein [Erysipelotrichaceae bacterium]